MKRKKNNLKVLPDSVLTLDPKGSTALTGFGITQTYDLLQRGIMPSIVVGRRYYIPKAALLRWLDNCGGSQSHAIHDPPPAKA
jgi:hypothetical protein